MLGNVPWYDALSNTPVHETLMTLTDVVLQAQGQFGPQHDERKGGVEVHVVCVVHSVLLTCEATKA